MKYTEHASQILKEVHWHEPTHRPERCFITSRLQTDGAGAQSHARLSIMMMAEFARIKYLHKPFFSVRSEIGQCSPQANAIEWEALMNLGDRQIPSASVKTTHTVQLDPLRIHQCEWEDDTTYVVPHCHTFSDYYPERYPALIARLKLGAPAVPSASQPRFDGRS